MRHQEYISLPKIKGASWVERLLKSCKSPQKISGELSQESPGQLGEKEPPVYWVGMRVHVVGQEAPVSCLATVLAKRSKGLAVCFLSS